jgi:hypothetical protein
MRRIIGFVTAGLTTAVLAGCPIYPGNDYRVCASDACYSCPTDSYTSQCDPFYCSASADCPASFECASDQRCHAKTGGVTPVPTTPVPTTQSCAKPEDCPAGSVCGADNKCHVGDCATSGCPSAYVCLLASGKATCTPRGGNTTPSICSGDAECSAKTPGAKCLSGSCVAPADQCLDSTQCGAGLECVEGSCTPSCSSTKACPTGFSCDLGKGVCTGNPSPCKSNAQCTGGNLCVDERCVAPCGAGDTCSQGLICVGGGCIADEKPVFVCDKEGEQGACSTGSVCLRHSCYIGCDPNSANACKTSDQFNKCKPVASSGKSYNICGSETNFGTDCGPEKACASGLVCIDGFCR